jgi:tetratricopeptide (TPR) repeat protein
MCPVPAPLGALRTKRLVGRTKEREAIKAAIEAESELRVIHVIGEGGIGKSRLLEAIPGEILPTCSNKDRCQFGGILDFYHADIHTNSGLEATIIQAVDPKERGFKAYRGARDELERLRLAGGRQFEEIRRKLGEYFVQGLNEITAKRRVILCFDTVETIQYESDIIESLIDTGVTGMEVEDWLTTHIPNFKNAVIIFSGRHNPRLEEDFRRHLGGTWQSFELGGFTEKEVADYLKALKASHREVREQLEVLGLPTDWHGVAHLYTGGHPLDLALILELVRRAVHPPSPLRDSLQTAQARTEEERREIREELEKALLTSILNEMGTDLPIVLTFLWVARKGLNAELLERLLANWPAAVEPWGTARWSQEECRQVLDSLRPDGANPLAFIKTREGTDLVFLHDRMYELMERYLEEIQPHFDRNVRTAYESIVSYYDGKIKDTRGRERHRLQVERLYYQFCLNPKQGYDTYSGLSDEAIISHGVGLDLLLRDEMLRFFRPDQPDNPVLREAQYFDPALTAERINRGLAIRWVRRLMAVEDWERAEEAARRLRESALVTPLDPYFVPILLVYESGARAYREHDFPGRITTLEQAIDEFERTQPEPGSRLYRVKTLNLGGAYNWLGYMYARQKHYQSAIAAYRSALIWHEESGVIGQQADTLRNMAYIYSLQGNMPEARRQCAKALEKSRQIHSPIGEALSLNVLGLIELHAGRPREALGPCERALPVFTELSHRRGQGLAYLALGQAWRKIVGLNVEVLDLEEAEAYFGRSLKHLKEARRIFEDEVKEPVRLLEAYAQLGCTYRDQATFYRKRGNGQVAEADIEALAQKAEEALRQSITVAESLGLEAEKADALNDIAEIYYHAKKHEKAEALLQKSDLLIPEGYHITKEKGIAIFVEEPISGLWQILGKNALERGRIAFDRTQYEAGMEHCLLAHLYFQLFSAGAVETAFREHPSQQLYESLCRLPTLKLEELQKHVEEVAVEYNASQEPGTQKLLRTLTSALAVVQRTE